MIVKTLALLVVLAVCGGIAVAGDLESSVGGGSRELNACLSCIQQLKKARHQSQEMKRGELEKLRAVANWESVMWEHLANLSRRGIWTEEDEREDRARRDIAEAEMKMAADANGGRLPATHPASQAHARQLNRRGDGGAARQEISEILDGLAIVPSNEAVALIAPLLEAKGVEAGRDDIIDDPISSRARDALRAMLVQQFPFKGNAPGVEEARQFMDDFHRGFNEPVALKPIPGEVEDWRKWWRCTKAQYGSRFELPAELRVLEIQGRSPER